MKLITRMNLKVLLNKKIDLFSYFEMESVLSLHITRWSKFDHQVRAVRKRLRRYTKEKEDLYIPVFL